MLYILYLYQNMDEMEITMEKDQLIIEQYKKRTLNLPSNEFIEISSCLNILETLMRQRNVKVKNKNINIQYDSDYDSELSLSFH